MKRLPLGLCVAPVLGLLAAGCGGNSFNQNATAVVTLSSRSLDDLELIVTAPTASLGTDGNCREGRVDFGCTQTFFLDATLYRFRTMGRASSDPFGVYVRNRGTVARTGSVSVDISDRTVQAAFSLDPGQVQRLINIRRYNADLIP